MLENPDVRRFMRVAELVAGRGWAEANAGNISVRFNGDQLSKLPKNTEKIGLKYPFPALNGRIFLMTATGSRARDIPILPEENIGLVEIIDEGGAIRCRWGACPPTSEFPAHMSIYEMCEKSRPEMKAILHTHPPNLVAMSHLDRFSGDGNPDALGDCLMRMHPEVGILLPDGIANMGYRIPGSLELGEATRDALRSRNIAVWPMHGVVSLAADLDKALDQVEIVEKAALVYLKIHSTGQEPGGLTDKQIAESREFWGIG